MIKLKIVAVSANQNSFGLHSMILIGSNGECWHALANYLNVKPRNTILIVPENQSIATFLTLKSFENPIQLPDPPEKLLRKTWNSRSMLA